MLTKEPKKKAVVKLLEKVNLFLTLAIVTFIAHVVLVLWVDSFILAFPAGLFVGLWIYNDLITPDVY